MYRSGDGQRRRAAVWALAAAGIVIAAAGVLLQQGSGEATEPPSERLEFVPSGEAGPNGGGGTLTMVDQKFVDTPRGLTETECAAAKPRMEAQASLWRERIQGQPNENVLDAQLTAALTDSRDWFAKGCQGHSKLGYYDAVDGSGAIKSVILNFP